MIIKKFVINFKHTVDIKKKYTFHIKSKNIEILPGDDVNDIIKELADSFYKNYEEWLLILRNGSGYVYDNVEVLGIHFHKMQVKRGKKPTINPWNTKDNRCFLYAITIALNHQEISYHPERIWKLILFIPKYNWDGTDFPTGRKEWKIFEKKKPRDSTWSSIRALQQRRNKDTIQIKI